MVGIIIGAAVLVLLLLIFFLPYGVDVRYQDSTVYLNVKAGPLRIRILPKKPKTEKQLAKAQARKEKKEAKKAAKAEKKAQEAADAEPAPEKKKKKKLPDLDFLWALVQMGIRAIRRFFRSFSFDYLQLRLIAGGSDPYAVSQMYSAACAAVEAAPSLAGEHILARRRDIEIGCDFTLDSPVIEGQIVISLQLYRLVVLGAAFGIEFLIWKLKHRPLKDKGTDERKDNHGREQDH